MLNKKPKCMKCNDSGVVVTHAIQSSFVIMFQPCVHCEIVETNRKEDDEIIHQLRSMIAERDEKVKEQGCFV